MIRRSQRIAGMFSYDVYAAHFPNIVYALRSLRDGHGGFASASSAASTAVGRA